MGTRKPVKKNQASSRKAVRKAKPLKRQTKTGSMRVPRQRSVFSLDLSADLGKSAPAGKKIRVQGRDEFYILRTDAARTAAGKKTPFIAKDHAHHHESEPHSIWCESCQTDPPAGAANAFYFLKTGGGKPTPEC